MMNEPMKLHLNYTDEDNNVVYIVSDALHEDEVIVTVYTSISCQRAYVRVPLEVFKTAFKGDEE